MRGPGPRKLRCIYPFAGHSIKGELLPFVLIHEVSIQNVGDVVTRFALGLVRRFMRQRQRLNALDNGCVRMHRMTER